MKAWRWTLFLGTAAVLAACDGKKGKGDVPFDTISIQQRVTLEGFGTCAQLEQYIEDTAVLDMRTTLERQKRTNGHWRMIDGPMPEAAAADGVGSAPPSSGPQNYTTTNTQVAGVDEADFVKNDGTRIFVLSGNRLYVNKSWPAAELSTAASVPIEGWPTEMFLDDKNHVIVFSNVWERLPFEPGSTATGGDLMCLSMECGYWHSNSVKITVVDVSTLSAPRISDGWYLPGSYVSSRRIGSSVRLVLRDSFRWPLHVRWWPESLRWPYDQQTLEEALDELMVTNERLIRAATLDDWLPQGKHKLENGTLDTLSYDCRDFFHSNTPAKLGLVTVATLNLDNPGNGIQRTSIVAEAGQIYASTKNLYVASDHWWWWPEPGQTTHTYLHKFDITNPTRADYVASGGVEGIIVDQFSMDEDAAGNFRVATTVDTRVADTQNPENWWGRMETTNRVSVLGEREGSLRVIGRTDDLAKGERIYSSRFIGTKGFVVTFRQVDPLFTLDLTDPANPRKVGELKIPGFSTYIHPLDEGHLLTIGTYIDAANTWSSRQLQLSIFDVTNLANPQQTHTQTVGTAYGWSAAMYDHKAFNYFAAKKLLAIPFWDYQPTSYDYWGSFVSELRVFGVDAITGFTEKGAMNMKDIYVTYNDYGWCYYWQPWIRRSVMADDYVYAISDGGIRVANIANLAAPLATVTFNKASDAP